jgi:hypothetical protein
MPSHDIDVRRIGWAGAAIALGVAAAVIAVFALLHRWDVPAGADPVRLPYDVVIQGPALQSAPQRDAGRAASATGTTRGPR